MAESLDTMRDRRIGRSRIDPCEAKAVSSGGAAMSYRKVADRAATVATGLAELGVRTGERVLIMLPDGPGFVEAFVGVMQRGAVPLPVNPLLSGSDITAIAAEADARLVVASEEGIRALTDLEVGPLALMDEPQGLWAAALRLS